MAQPDDAVTLEGVLKLARIHPEALGCLPATIDEPRAVLRDLPLDRAVVAVMQSVERSQIPDLPERIIAVTAKLYEVPVISCDRQIRLAAVETIW